MARFYDSVFPFHGRPFFAKRSNMMTNILKKMRREVEEAVKLKNNSGNVFGFFYRSKDFLLNANYDLTPNQISKTFY